MKFEIDENVLTAYFSEDTELLVEISEQEYNLWF